MSHSVHCAASDWSVLFYLFSSIFQLGCIVATVANNEHFKQTKQNITADQRLHSVLLNLLSGEELAGVERRDCVLGDLLGAALLLVEHRHEVGRVALRQLHALLVQLESLSTG